MRSAVHRRLPVPLFREGFQRHGLANRRVAHIFLLSIWYFSVCVSSSRLSVAECSRFAPFLRLCRSTDCGVPVVVVVLRAYKPTSFLAFVILSGPSGRIRLNLDTQSYIEGLWLLSIRLSDRSSLHPLGASYGDQVLITCVWSLLGDSQIIRTSLIEPAFTTAPRWWSGGEGPSM